jgi:cell division protease FtsH
MIGRWGMSATIGVIAALPADGQGPFLPGASDPSEETRRIVDEEVRKLVAAAHDEVTELLRTNRDKLDSLAKALLEHETLDQLDAYAAAGVPLTDEARQPVAASA